MSLHNQIHEECGRNGEREKKRREERVEKGDKTTGMRDSKRIGIKEEESKRKESNSEDKNRDTKKCPSPITKGTNSFTLKTFTKGTNSKTANREVSLMKAAVGQSIDPWSWFIHGC